MISFPVFFVLLGRKRSSAPLPSRSASQTEGEKAAAVGCGLPVDVLEGGLGHLANISQD